MSNFNCAFSNKKAPFSGPAIFNNFSTSKRRNFFSDNSLIIFEFSIKSFVFLSKSALNKSSNKTSFPCDFANSTID